MRKRVVWIVVVVVAAAALVGIGRAEREHHADLQNARIAKVIAAVGPLDSKSLDAYRVRPGFDCLIYKRGKNPYALELCIDHSGRVIEAIDRRHGTPYIGSVREEHPLASHKVSLAEVQRLLKMMDAQAPNTVSGY
jgi:hypothetical protein